MEVKEYTDEEKQRILKFYNNLNFANLSKSILQDLRNNNTESVLYKKYKKEDILKFLENPQKNEKQIRELSNFLYIVSSHYRRLIDYFPLILLYHYNVIPTKVPKKIIKSKYLESYVKIITECDKYHLKHEAIKSIKVAIREGVFFGLWYETSDSFYIKQVMSDYSQISGIEDGTFIFEFDLNYFNGKKDLLKMYGQEFVDAYDRYKGNEKRNIKADKTKRWYEPKNQICLKCDESDPYHNLPYFTGLLDSIFNIDEYKMLHKVKAENENFKALSLKIPTDADGVPLLSFEDNYQWFNHIVDNVSNSSVGIFMSPFVVDDFSFSSNNTSDATNIINAEEEFYMSSGINPLLFGSAKANSSSSMLLSVKPDEQIVYSILLQFQRFFNKKIKKMNLEYEFKIEFLPQSIFNQTEYVDRFSKAATLSAPAKTMYASSLGLSPLDSYNLTILEEDILGLSKKRWVTPLVSSNTQSSVGNTGGRPTAEESGKTIGDAGEQSRNDDVVDDRL